MLEKLAMLWCRVGHSSIMYAGGQHYRCRACLRVYQVPWVKLGPPNAVNRPRALATTQTALPVSVSTAA